jgi:hypothetical protein
VFGSYFMCQNTHLALFMSLSNNDAIHWNFLKRRLDLACLINGPLFPNKVSSRCPAIFAVRHNASVPGRIRLLIVLMITINVIGIVGVPLGTRCSNM